jgi:tetratricopeptide (TPR) repeat protein
MSVTAFAIAMIVAAPLTGPAAAPMPASLEANDPVIQPMAGERSDEALAKLAHASAAKPHDAALLINLGIAYAQRGEEAKARAAFEQAAACHEVIELTTADGSETDSRRLARKALKMLARGEFTAQSSRADQLTYRD